MKHAYRKYGNIETKIPSFWRNFHKWLCRKLLRTFHNQGIRAFICHAVALQYNTVVHNGRTTCQQSICRELWTWQIPSIRIPIVKKNDLHAWKPWYGWCGTYWGRIETSYSCHWSGCAWESRSWHFSAYIGIHVTYSEAMITPGAPFTNIGWL